MSSSSYLIDNDGKFIPATQRPDGTWRKARRVKDGYVPQEEVPLYESKGKQFAQRKSDLPPGMCPLMAEAAKKEREKQERIKAKKEAAAATNSGNKKSKQSTPGILLLPDSTTSSKSKPNDFAAQTNAAVNTLSADLETALQIQDGPEEQAKKLKKLRKKLREIETIEEKIKTGELKKPEKDQIEKMKRKKDIIKKIKSLEDETSDVNAVN